MQRDYLSNAGIIPKRRKRTRKENGDYDDIGRARIAAAYHYNRKKNSGKL